MSGPKKLTLRVQSAEGTARVELADSEATARLYELVHEALRLTSFGFALHKDRQRREEIASSKSRQLRDHGLRHGDMIYLSPVNGAVLFDQATSSAKGSNERVVGEGTEAGPSSAAAQPTGSQSNLPIEDEVDLILYKEDGKIQRQRDEKLCRHNSAGCCVHCSPLEPWDETYLKEHNIKHMSFHSYLRKLTAGTAFIALNELSLKIKPGCKEHPPWPRGICSGCQPGAVTLTRQQYRHVDNLDVETAAMVERFLAYWRATSHQRLGILYGTYEPYRAVPLGIRARVAAIYEPAQTSSRDHVSLQPDRQQAALEALAAALHLRPVGWMFTDLLPAGPHSVQHLRGADTHFLSAQECIMAGHLQNEHPSACRYASQGTFGSKFVTVCVTGDSSQQVHMEGYQVSEQCAALVRDEVLLPTRDAPDLGYIRDSTDRQYVPDLYYKERDVYGNEVGVSAKRLPVAYLLVDVPVGAGGGGGAPPTFSERAAFPPAHRPLQGHLQTLAALHHELQRADTFLQAMSDLHVLLYLMCNESVPLSLEQLTPLVAAVRARDEAAAERWRRDEPAWATLEHLAAAAAAAADAPLAAAPLSAHAHSSEGAGSVWTCPHCTFHNQPVRDHCDMCALPRQG